MYYSKPKILMSLLIAMGLAVPISAMADGVNDDGVNYFKGPMATCLTRAKVVYPCVSLSPPGYHYNSTFLTKIPAVDNLPLDSDKHESGWLAQLSGSELWNIKDLFANKLDDIASDITVGHSGSGMNMNLGPMKFNMYVDEEHFSESRFILGIDHAW